MARRLTAVFDRIAEATMLTMAFARVKENEGGPGGDGVTISDFERRLANEVTALVSELMAGTYAPRPARAARMPKKSGGFRDLSIPAVRDRVVQSAASTVLIQGLEPEMEESSFGYRPGRSVQQAVRMVDKHRRDGFRWAVDADIRSFFDSVPHDRLIRRLQDHVNDGRFVDLVSLWLETYGTGGRGLPQGSPISPVLANLYLDTLDEAFDERDTRLVRYADDFVILTRDAAAAEAARERAAQILQKEGLELHRDKTRIVPFDRGLHFLGHMFVRSVVIEDPWDDPVFGPPGEPQDDEDRTGQPPRTRRVLYLATAGTHAAVGTGGTIEVSEAGRPRLRLKPHMIDRVELHPDTEVSAEALRELLLARVPVVFVDARGAALGSLGPRAGLNARLHLAQARAVSDEGRRRALAEVLVSSRIHNHRALLRRLNRQRGDPDVVRACEEINRILRKLPHAETTASLMAYEGHSAQAYWKVLGRLLPNGWTFQGRGRRPPATPFDAILSFLSTLLTNDVERAVIAAGLHPGFAVLHSSKNNETACATDLVEQFRGPLAESTAVTLVAQRGVSVDGFVADDQLGWTVDPTTREALIRGYERSLARTVADPFGEAETPWRTLIERQVKRYAKAILDDAPYQAYRMDY